MSTSMRRSVGLFGSLFALTSIFQCFGTAQENPAKFVPWPPIFVPLSEKIPAGSIQSHPALTSNRATLYTTGLNVDSTTFTPISTPFPGVMAGDAEWIDYDNDGKLDVILSGYTDSGNIVTNIYRNEGDSFTDIHANTTPLRTERGVAWGDFDNDGDFDLAMEGNATGSQPFTKIYRNDNGTFVDIGAPLMGLNGGSVVWVDYNNDGQLDLLVSGSPDVGSTFYTKLYRNDHGSFVDSGIDFPGVWASSIAFADYDNDGNQDLLLTGFGDLGVTTKLYHCEIHSDTVTYTDTYEPLEPVNSGMVKWVDIDNDGFLDIILSGVAPGNIPRTIIYRNDGAGHFTDIQANLKQVCVSAIAVGDYDNDGDLDIAVSGSEDFIYGTNPTTKIYRNDHGAFVDIGAVLPGTWFGTLAWGDYDNDGRLDLLITGGTVGRPNYSYNGPWYSVSAIYHNNSVTPNTPPSVPAAPIVSLNGSDAQFSWSDATDNQTSTSALTYNMRIGTHPGGYDVLSPIADVATGYRRIPARGNIGHRLANVVRNLPPGTYYWNVQTVDNAYSGSGFTTEASFTVPPRSNVPTWQMISLPYHYPDTHKSVLFPDAVSPAFTFSNVGGYEQVGTLDYGIGYWVKFQDEGFPTMAVGDSLSSVTVLASHGWNMIGTVSRAIIASTIVSNPPGIVVSNFYGYNGSYVISDTLQPGRAYWIKVNTSGSLTLSSIPSANTLSRVRIVPTSELPPPPPNESEMRPELPRHYSLRQAYPNPFNPATKIEYDLPRDSKVTLRIYNLLGQLVTTLVDRIQDAGYKSVDWNATNNPSGIYFYRIEATDIFDHTDTYVEARKVILVR